MNYFDSKYQKQKTSKIFKIFIFVVNTNKHVFFKNVYVFIDRLKNLMILYNENQIQNVFIVCFRDFVLMWYFFEIIDLIWIFFQNASFKRWYAIFIDKFKFRISITFAQFIKRSYSLINVRHIFFRVWCMQRLQLSKKIQLSSIYN